MPEVDAGSLLGFAGAMALGALGKEAASKGIDARDALGMLEDSRDEITGALPTDFAGALAAAGLLPAASRAPRPRPPHRGVRPRPPPSEPRRRRRRRLDRVARSGWSRWRSSPGSWRASSRLRPSPWSRRRRPPRRRRRPRRRSLSPRRSPQPEPEPQPAPEPAAPAPAAPSDTAAAPATPLFVGGVDIGAAVSATLAGLSTTFGGITDPASAQAALPKLTEARDALAGFEARCRRCPRPGTTALQQMVKAALPAIQTAAERLKADGPIAAVVGPVVDDILARLTAFSA